MTGVNNKNPLARQWLVLVLVLLIVGVGGGARIYQEHGRTGAREKERLLTQARIVQENLAWNLDALNKSLTSLQRDPSLRAYPKSYNQRFSDLADAMPGVRTILAMDAGGTIRIANKQELVGRNLSDRDYFTRPKQSGNPDLLYVSPPFKTVLGTHVINLSRIVPGPKGEFAGVVAASLDPEYFRNLLASVLYEDDMWTSIVHGDGMLFLSVRDRTGAAGKELSPPGTLINRSRDGGNGFTAGSGGMYATSGLRVTALQTIQPANLKMDRPLIVTATRDIAAVYSVWRSDAIRQLILFVLFALVSSLTLHLYRKRQQEIERQKATASENIRLLNEELDRFFSMSLDLLSIADAEGRFRRLNRSWEDTLGYSLDELIGSNFVDYVHPDDQAATLDAMAELNADNPVLSFVNRYRRKDGTYRWVEWRATPYRSRLIYAAARDITELKLQQQALEKSERFMRMLTDIIPGMVGYWNSELRCGFANIAYLEWFGRTPEQMRGMHIRELMGDDLFSKNEPFINAALRGERQQFERTLTKADGSTGYTWAHYIPDVDGDQVRGFFVLVSDVTELKLAHIRLEQLNDELTRRTAEAESANRAKSEFLANMSHEIRTPMNAILGLTRLVLETELTPRQSDCLGKVYSSSQAMMGILNDILDYSKIEAGRLEIERLPVSVADIIRDSAELFSARFAEKGLAIVLEVDSLLPEVVISDPLRLSQVLNNLLGNAVKFTERGEIRIKAELVSAEGDAMTLRFAVSDTGIGLSKGHSDRLFQAFTQADSTITRKYGGTGLGLTICQRLVRLMGGEIQVSSMEGAGATFTFVIQAGKAPPGAHAARRGPRKQDESITGVKRLPAAAPEQGGLLGARILLVEDNRINQEVASEFLRQQGASVTLADHGAEALALIRRPSFDVVLMDLHMPVMDGFEATRRIREMHGSDSLPIIAMTAAVMQDDRERCAAAGMVDFIAKPIDPDELFSVLQRWFKTAGPAAIRPLQCGTPQAGEKALPLLSGFDTGSALRRSNGDVGLLCRLLHEFAGEHGQASEQVKALLFAGKRGEALHLVHAIKGMAANLGAVELAESAAVLEQELKDGAEPVGIRRFEQECAAAVSAITFQVPGYPGEKRRDGSCLTATELASLAELLAELAIYLQEQELAPDDLMQKLGALADSHCGGEIPFRLKALLRQMDRFDHGGALETVRQLNDELKMYGG